ncbi:hypothetical protein [Curtobacterium sp. VKM Ac-1393]|uniref:hypothetical protein n=1 Tax=Curtobacterium sp. VKM Ac-1393 TaxID=2783814 RepID=UPI00188B3945|nr:hypothetical protein [Curtobacterium sp. VKM Ac-1393]MBF4607551.1 hypothetical protein [Curtobacterium sp. VKM Ac-1393]
MSTPAHEDFVAVKPGLLFPRTISGFSEGVEVVDIARAGLSGTEPSPYGIAVTATWSEERLAYEIDKLEVRRNYSNEPITALGLRRVRLQEVFQAVVMRDVRYSDGSPVPVRILPSDPAKRRQKSEAERLRIAAEVYALARAFGERPLKAVAETLGVSQSTATRLAARAREEGLLS